MICYTLYYIVCRICDFSSLLLFGWGDPPDSSTLGDMTVPKDDKLKDYARYAEHCLNMVASTGDRELRRIQREMAAKWIRD